MIYREFKGMDISAMAFGAMRLPVIGGKDADIDEEKAYALVDRAYKAGINYFDTAWGYHWGNSETFMGKALKKYPRDSFYLATKFPGYDLSNFGKAEEIFEKQLEKCQVDYFDFYLIHNVNETNIDAYLDDCRYMTVSYLLTEVKKGRIKHLGFSCHGSAEVMERFLAKYGMYMEFGMVELNYVDYNFQDTKGKVETLRKYNLPVWVMEPLRGGMLSRLPDDQMERLGALRPGMSAVEWAFRYLQSFPDVVTILSGMTQMDQMEEKLEIFLKEDPLKGIEIQTLHEVADSLLNGKIAPCTSCRYCMSHCPKEIDIPGLIKAYNEEAFSPGAFLAAFGVQAAEKGKRPADCIGCRSCEKVCPQQLKVSEIMKTLDEKTKAIRQAFFKE